MRIGILTQPLGMNYGGILQAYALQRVLREMGHDPVILDREPSERYRLLRWGWWIMFYLLGQREKIRLKPNARERAVIRCHTDRFIREHIALTEPIDSTSGLRRAVGRLRLDAVVVGSDQVWRKTYSPCLPNYFLDFLDGNDQIRKIAYAASFGIDEWEYGPKETEYLALLAQQFDAISVREDSAVTLCREHLGVEATHILDPTMLLDRSVYEELALSPVTRPSSGDLFCCILDRTPEKMRMVEEVAVEQSLTPFELLPPKSFVEIRSSAELEECVLPPVEQWLRSFLEAKMVVTDSFHGTVFSILFGRPFLVIGNSFRGLTRFTSLLRDFDLTDLYLSHLQPDYDRIGLRMAERRQASLDYLSKAL